MSHDKYHLCHEEVVIAAKKVAGRIVHTFAPMQDKVAPLYGVPRGGIPAMYAVANQLTALGVEVTYPPEPFPGCFIIDDLIDSGATRDRYLEVHPAAHFFALFDKSDPNWFPQVRNTWLVFPWEVTAKGEDESATDICTRLLEYIGEDPHREGLQETPKRWLKAMKHWMGGYGMNPADVMKVFEDGAEGCDEMVLVRDIPFFSHCEHHIAPIIGVAHVAYIPNGKIIGLSKLARLVDLYARRLQVQERLTNQVAEALQEHLQPLGCGVVIEARHLCMESRGVQKAGSYTVTSALHGVFKEDGKARDEFLMLTRGDRNRVL